jgi:hypothetical protein
LNKQRADLLGLLLLKPVSGSVAVAVNMNCRRVDAIDALTDARVVCRWVYICSFALPQSFY